MHWQSLRIHSQQWKPKGDRQTDRQASTDPFNPSQTVSPQLSAHMELSGTSRADPVLPGGQQGPPQKQIPAPGSSKPPSHASPALPRHNRACRSLSATWEAAGGHPAGKGSSPAWAWQSIKDTQIPSLASQTFLTPAAASSWCLGSFVSKLGRKSLRDHNH